MSNVNGELIFSEIDCSHVFDDAIATIKEMPLILGSPISFVITLAYIPIIALRIHNEERVLELGLQGYREYKQRVRYKVLPYVW
mgnify:CR=1 FL=1